MRIEQLEKDAENRAEEAESLSREAEERKKQADELCALIDKLWAAHAEIGSDELRTAIETSQESKREVERGLEEALEKRDRMVSDTEKDIERCDRYLGYAQKALDWGPPLTESLVGSYSPFGKGATYILDNVEQTVERTRKTKNSYLQTLDKLSRIRQRE
ncbi:MAG: hypothetical protein V4671_25040 [Armatimonadota bacterium]